MERIYLYTRFERLWHWLQAVLVIVLIITGFVLHGTFSFLSFERAYLWHICAGIFLFVLTCFAVFWHLTTGTWRQYLPIKEKLSAIIRYYLKGIFRGEPPPFKKRPDRKLNPLQRLVYLFLKLVLFPVQFVSASALLFVPWLSYGKATNTFSLWAYFHTAGAFGFLIFLIAHVYLATTARPWYAYLRAMITGWEEVPEEVSVPR